jgi:hypothetical protein
MRQGNTFSGNLNPYRLLMLETLRRPCGWCLCRPRHVPEGRQKITACAHFRPQRCIRRTVDGETVTTNAQGQASTPITANGIAGSFGVTASSSAVTGSAISSLTNLPVGSSSLAFVQQPSNAPARMEFTVFKSRRSRLP